MRLADHYREYMERRGHLDHWVAQPWSTHVQYQRQFWTTQTENQRQTLIMALHTAVQRVAPGSRLQAMQALRNLAGIAHDMQIPPPP